jgi:hypothetical protein
LSCGSDYSSGLTNNRLDPRPGPTTDGFVTRKEYDEPKAELLAMKKESDALKKDKKSEAVTPDRSPRREK